MKIDKKIKKSIETGNLSKIDYIIYYYSPDKNNEIYKIFVENFIGLEIPFYLFLEYDTEINTEQNMAKLIKLLELLAKNTSEYSKDNKGEKEQKRSSNEEKEMIKDKINAESIDLDEYNEIISFRSSYNKERIIKVIREKKISIKKDKALREAEGLSKKYFNSYNKIINLYTFFKSFKNAKNKLINIINNNYVFFRETIEVLLEYITFRYKFQYYIKEIKNKQQKEFLNLQIFEFFQSLFNSNANNELLKKYFENPIKNEKLKYKINLRRFFQDTFIQKIEALNTDKIPNKEYESFKQILIKFCGYNYKNNKLFKKTLAFLFIKDIRKLIDFLNIDINKDEISMILNNYSKTLINKNINKSYKEYFPIFYNIKSLYVKKELIYPLDLELISAKELNNIYFSLVFIYINQVYPSYNPSLLYYIYTKFYKKDAKKFFISFINCLTDKENQNNIQGHLFLEKFENSDDNKNTKFDVKKICIEEFNKSKLFKKFFLL